MNPETLQTGDILHCRGKGVISTLIMWSTKSSWSHTAIFIEIWEQPYILEAQRKGVHVVPYYKWLKKYGYEFEISRNRLLTDHNLYSISAMSKVGTTGYDFASLLIRFPISLITGRWKKIKFESNKMFCSEYALWTHDVEKAYRMTPHQVYEHCGTVEGWDLIESKY